MRKAAKFRFIFCLICALSLFPLAGCAGEPPALTEPLPAEPPAAESTVPPDAPPPAEEASAEPEIVAEVDWSRDFEGIRGAAVIYTPADRTYQIYRPELASLRRSPCSTFKIISSLIALEHGVLDPDSSTRPWSGEVFWNENWNQDLDFYSAFRHSCVWYFRQVVDEIGQELMEEELRNLQYGNCDLSDWDGRLNTNNHNPALTGFWIESSLLISPREQVEVLARVFGKDTAYSPAALDALKQAMLQPELTDSSRSLYGKTGMGKREGVVVDAWFTGFADEGGTRRHFCVYLGETEGKNVSSAKAREIAIRLLSSDLGENDQNNS